MTFLPPPHGKCGTLKYRVLENFPYSFPMCKLDCSLEDAFKRCGCVEFKYKDFIGNLYYLFKS